MTQGYDKATWDETIRRHDRRNMTKHITLFSTFISPGEILDWEPGGTIALCLIDEAYARWLDEDTEQAELYEDCWKGFVHVKPSGGYNVWLEADPDTGPTHEVKIPIDMARRCYELIEELRRIGKMVDGLRIDTMPTLSSLDRRASDIQEELSDELISLLVDNNLAAPLVKEQNDTQV